MVESERTTVGVVKSKSGSVVRVNKIEGMSGYEYQAENMESLPLAVELALDQTHFGGSSIEDRLRGRVSLSGKRATSSSVESVPFRGNQTDRSVSFSERGSILYEKFSRGDPLSLEEEALVSKLRSIWTGECTLEDLDLLNRKGLLVLEETFKS